MASSIEKPPPYNPKANGLTERANGIVGNILTKVVSANKTDWDEKLYSAVYAYNTTIKTTTGKSPYFLVYGQEVIQKVETEVETHRIMAFRHGQRVESVERRLEEVEELEEARAEALQQTRNIQEKRKEKFDEKVPEDNGITEGGMVLLYDSRLKTFPGKLQTRWVGPFLVHKVYGNGSLQLKELTGALLATRTNGSRVKLYRPKESSDHDSGNEF